MMEVYWRRHTVMLTWCPVFNTAKPGILTSHTNLRAAAAPVKQYMARICSSPSVKSPLTEAKQLWSFLNPQMMILTHSCFFLLSCFPLKSLGDSLGPKRAARCGRQFEVLLLMFEWQLRDTCWIMVRRERQGQAAKRLKNVQQLFKAGLNILFRCLYM